MRTPRPIELEGTHDDVVNIQLTFNFLVSYLTFIFNPSKYFHQESDK